MNYLKKKLQQLKTIKVEGIKFVIKKINPFLDFRINEMPTIFTEYFTERKPEPKVNEAYFKKILEEMKLIVEKGVVKPELVPLGKGEKRGKEEGITVDDLFVDIELGTKLYFEIMAHSLNRFKGLKGLFFSVKIKQLLFTEWHKNIINLRQILSSGEITN